jgi:hypothetical protein
MAKPKDINSQEGKQWEHDLQFYLKRKHSQEDAERLATESLVIARKKRFDNIKPQQEKPWGQRRRKP